MNRKWRSNVPSTAHAYNRLDTWPLYHCKPAGLLLLHHELRSCKLLHQFLLLYMHDCLVVFDCHVVSFNRILAVRLRNNISIYNSKVYINTKNRELLAAGDLRIKNNIALGVYMITILNNKRTYYMYR